MSIYYYNINKYKPFIFLISKIDKNFDENKIIDKIYDKLLILYNNDLLNQDNIIIYSIINNKKNFNYFIPSINSNEDTINKYMNNNELLNNMIVDILNYNSNCYIYNDNIIKKNIDLSEYKIYYSDIN
jgi:hypothetical protein